MALLVARSQGLVRGTVAPPPQALPTGYPAQPSFAGATEVTVSTGADLVTEFNNATSAGKIIYLSASLNNYGQRTVSAAANAKVKIVSLAPRITQPFITERSALDQFNLNAVSSADAVTIQRCIPGGLAAHTNTTRLGLTISRAGIVWIEGIDFHSPGVDGNGARTYALLINPSSNTTLGVDQLWVKNCTIERKDNTLIMCGGGNEDGSGNTGRGADIIVSWNNYLYGEGTIRDPGDSGSGGTGVGVLTDYIFRFYGTGNNGGGIYAYKTIFAGGSNHTVSTKFDCGNSRYDDCVFVPWHNITGTPIAHSHHFELGQAGSPTGNDRTCGNTTIQGCTFAAFINSPNNPEGRIIQMTDATGFTMRNCLIYGDSNVTNRGRDFWRSLSVRFSGPNDQGRLAGSDGVLVENCTFRNSSNSANGQPMAVDVTPMYTGTGGGYTFRARNNIYTTNRTVSAKNGKVTLAFTDSTTPGFA